jgi:hypothetical protein
MGYFKQREIENEDLWRIAEEVEPGQPLARCPDCRTTSDPPGTHGHHRSHNGRLLAALGGFPVNHSAGHLPLLAPEALGPRSPVPRGLRGLVTAPASAAWRGVPWFRPHGSLHRDGVAHARGTCPLGVIHGTTRRPRFTPAGGHPGSGLADAPGPSGARKRL